jgi:hypothetical protein
MAAPLKESKTEAHGATRRRSTRLAIAIPITISGKDSAGHAFKENSRTVVINKHGAKILTFHQLAMGTEIAIENRALGRTAKAAVVWQGEQPGPKDPMEVGIQLLHAENIWGIEFPPDDWQDGPSAGTVSRKPGAAPPSPLPSPGTPALVASVAQKVPAVPRRTVPPVVIAPPPLPTVTPEFLDSAVQASLARFTQQIEDTVNTQFRQFEERIASLMQQTGFQAQATLQDVANHQEERLAQEFEQQFSSLEQRLQAARADMETLLSRLEGLRQTTQAEVERAERNIQTASFSALQMATEELGEKVRKELEAASANFAEETRQRVEDAGSTAVETFSKEASARLTNLTEDSLAALAPEVEARRSQFEQTLVEVQQRGGREILERLQAAADESLDAAAKDLQRQAADALLLLTDELKTAGRVLVDEARQELTAATREASETIGKQAEAAKRSTAELEAARKLAVEEASKQLAAIAQETSQTIGKQAEAARRSTAELEAARKLGVEEVSKQLSAIAREASETIGKQAEAARLSTAELEIARRAAVEEVSKQLSAIAREASETISKQAETARLSTAELEIARRAAVEEARKQLAAVTREVLDTVSKDARAAQLSTAALEAAGKAAIEQTREQLSTLGRETMEMLTEEARALAKEYPVHVRKTLQDFQDQRTRELEDHLQKALEKQRQAVLKQVQKVGEEVAGQAVIQVRSKCEQVVKEITGDLEKQRGATAAALKDWDEQARARVDRLVANLSTVITEKTRQESEVLVKDFQGRLQHAARTFHEENVREIEEKLKESTLKQIEEFAAEFDKRAAENLELVSEQLKEKQEQAVEEATELFRTTIGQMFASLQIAPKKPSEAEPAKKRR